MAQYSTNQWITLDELTASYLDQSAQSSTQYRRVWGLAYRAMQELGMDVFYTAQTLKLTVEANKTVILPSDYISWIKVGVMNDKGEVATLRKNTQLTSYGIQSVNRLTMNTDGNFSMLFDPSRNFYSNFLTGGGSMQLFGLPAGTVNFGEFNIDEIEGLIYLDNNFDSAYIILEYLAAPTENSEYKIPIQCKEAVISYCAWKDIQYLGQGRRVNLSEKEERRRQWVREKRLARARVNPFRIAEANDTTREGTRLALKS